MKKTTRISTLVTLGALLLMLGVAVTAAAMDADELIRKSIEATGGEKAIKGKTSAKITGKVMAQGMEIPFTMYQKRPDLLRLDAQVMGMTMTQAYDGKQGWSINPMMGSMDPQPMDETATKGFSLQADMDGALVGYKDKGYTAEYLGEEDVEGTPCYKLRIDTKLDIIVDMFIDKEYFLPIKSHSTITIDETVVEQDSYMSDYQEVDGIVMPFAVETKSNGVTMMQMMMETVEYGVEIADDQFVMPAPAAKTE
ncbi:MAG: hypothetical protein AB7V45_03325 [Candidatus Krumholzibacteriia bacterium]